MSANGVIGKDNFSTASSLKQMLSIRNTTCTDLVYVETELLIQDKQAKFPRIIRLRHADDYIIKTIDNSIALKTPMGKTIHQIQFSIASYTVTLLNSLKTIITNSETAG